MAIYEFYEKCYQCTQNVLLPIYLFATYTLIELKKENSKWEIVSTEGKDENCSEKHFEIRDTFNSFKEYLPDSNFARYGDYLPDEDLEEFNVALAKTIEESERAGFSKQETSDFIRKIFSQR